MTYKILVVDDEVEICKLISKFLTKKGFQTLTVAGGEEALVVLEKEGADLVILDKRMPGIGGVGFLQELKKRKICVPVIILTGSRDQSDYTDAIKDVGCEDILLKPIALSTLLEMVQKVLKIK